LGSVMDIAASPKGMIRTPAERRRDYFKQISL